MSVVKSENVMTMDVKKLQIMVEAAQKLYISVAEGRMLY